MKVGKGVRIFAAAAFGFIVLIIIVAKFLPDGEKAVNPHLYSIQAFISSHSELGTFKKSSDLPNWASGARHAVRTSAGNFIFYMRGDSVDGVWRESPSEKIY